ncbi:MAG TPA: energy transducer TonB [Pyrinomonadaceae bacterium]|nr:energy transducer TonB [Pyrinomonadaceae bacterium]
MLESDPKLASDFANQSVQIEITDGLLWFLKNLRQKDQTEANRLFLNILQRYPQQANIDANQYAILGTYLFTSPNLNPQDHQTISMTRVGNIIIPNITANLPNIPANLIQEYVRNAVPVINRPSNDIRQRQLKYALGYLLLPKAQEFAPNLVGELGGAIAALASFVPPEIISEEAYSNVKKKVSGTLSERIEEIEKLPDAYSRDRLFLDVAFQAWRQKDFTIARIVAAKIEDKDARNELETVISFGEANHLLKDKQTNLFDVMRMAEKLPVSLEKSLLWLAIASVAEKAKQTSLAADALDSALKDAARLDDKNTPFLFLFVSGQTAKGNAFQSSAVLNEAIKSFNKFENIEKPSLSRNVTLEPLTLSFPLTVDGVNLDFQDSFQKAISGNEENGVQIIEGLKDENLKAQAFVALVKLFLAKETKNIKVKDQEAVKVGEDGIRKSAVKTVMPVYPKESLKKQAQGVAVAEVQYDGNGDVTDIKLLESPDSPTGKAVVDAMKQWKFNPSKLKGKPVSIRGKITFYFVINETGKGEVKNPKQFQ